MSVIQIILLAVVGAVALTGAVATARGILRRRECVLWMAICLFASMAVIWSDATTRLAKFFGVGRGTDLLLYVSVIVMITGFLKLYARVRRLRRELTLLTRALAIRDVVIDDTNDHRPNNEPSP